MVDQHRLVRCLNPASIAVVGGIEVSRVIEQCLKLKFEGDIWPVNPNRDNLGGIACFATIDDLPGIPDVTFIAIPADPSIEIIRKLDAMGAGGAICYASGFREVGSDGEQRHKNLLEAAGGMPVFGPNCHGFINTVLGAALWPDQHGLSRNQSGVAIISSSGNVSINFTLQQRGLPVATLISVGNQAIVNIEQCIAAVLENEKISAIGIHIEGLTDLPLFVELAKKARDKEVPIIVLKTGKSDIGARITLSHTATMAGEAGLYTALFDRLGIGQVETIEEFLEALKLAAITGPLGGNKIASMSCSGGEASLMADISVGRGLVFPKLEPDHAKALQCTLNEYVNVDNPLDYHTFIWNDKDRMTATFATMMAGGYDLTILVIDIPYVNDCDPADWDVALQSLIDASSKMGCKAVVVASMSENFTDSVMQFLISNGITPLLGMSQALAAVSALSKVGMAWERSWVAPELPVANSSGIVDAGEILGMDEYQAKQLIKQVGVSVPESGLVTSVDELKSIASKIKFPLVVKAVSSQIAHKSEINAVIVGVSSQRQLESETKRLLEISDTVMVEEMIQDSIAELLIGVSFDPQFGHYLILGFGGTMVELIGDREILLFPFSSSDIIKTLRKLKTWPLLDGFRGRAKADVDSVVETVLAISRVIENNKDTIVELEINPLMVRAEKSGAVVADALIRKRN